jgi:hypothetical protein
MDRIDLFSVICGLLAMCVTAQAAMALGYEGMSFERPWPQLAVGAVLVEVLLMRWMGPLPGALVAGLFLPLSRRSDWAKLLEASLFLLGIPATAIGLAFILLKLMRYAVQ